MGKFCLAHDCDLDVRVGDYLAPSGLALFSICSNSAYERLDGAGLALRTVGVEMTGNGFWRAIIGARRR